MTVYKATNSINGKVYICVTIRPFKVVKWQHNYNARSGNPMYFYEAMRKHGEHNFRWDILWRCQSITEMYSLKEQFIKEYNSFDQKFGYNGTTGNLHFIMNQDTKDRIYNGRKGYLSGLQREIHNRTEKKCHKCKTIKELNMFNSLKSSPDGYGYCCSKCSRKDQKKRRNAL